MKGTNLKHLFWEGSIEEVGGAEDTLVQRMFKAIIPLEVAHLSSPHVSTFIAYHDDYEVEHNMPFGDLVVEETDFNVPEESLVLISADGAVDDAHSASYKVGYLVAQALSKVVDSGDFPVTRETSALYALFYFFYDQAAHQFLKDLGVITDPFRKGMTADLTNRWTGAASLRRDHSGLFSRCDFLDDQAVVDYLLAIDPMFVAIKDCKYPQSRLPGDDNDLGETWFESMIRLLKEDLQDREDRFPVAKIIKFPKAMTK